MNLSNLSFSKGNRDRQYYFFLLIVFMVVCGLGMMNHEMWRDELQAWLVARDSNSILNLLYNLKHTGHPGLWYLCLYFLAKITSNPQSAQLLNFVIISSTVYLFLFYSPFNILQKTLFCFGYFTLYEYGIISRSYGLGMFLVFLFCAFYCRTKPSYIVLAIILAMLSHTSVYSLLIGMVLAAIVFVPALVERSQLKSLFQMQNIVNRLTASIAIYSAGLFGAMWQIIPPANVYKGRIDDVVKSNPAEIQIDTVIKPNSAVSYPAKELLDMIREAERVFTGILRSYAPIPDFAGDGVWGSNILTDGDLLPEIATSNLNLLISALLSVLLLIIFAAIFSNNYKALFIYAFGTIGISLFGIIFYLPSLRHNGHLFVLLIISFWIYLYQRRHDFKTFTQYWLLKKIRKYQHFILSLILCLQVYGGVSIYLLDLQKPFSRSYDVAQFIIDNQLENSIIVANRNAMVSPLSAWLNKELFYPEIDNFGTYTIWTAKTIAQRHERKKKYKNVATNNNPTISMVSPEDVIKQVELLSRDRSEDILLVLSRKLDVTSSVLDISLLASFENASKFSRENYYVYSVD